MFKVLKISVCFISILLSPSSAISRNSYRESNYEISEQVCGPDSIYCSESNVCLKIDCVHKNLIDSNNYHRSNGCCPIQTNYRNQTDECLPNCSQTTKRENKYILVCEKSFKFFNTENFESIHKFSYNLIFRETSKRKMTLNMIVE